MSMEKRGVVDENTPSDFDRTKKAEFFDEEGFGVADKANKEKLRKPQRFDWYQTDTQE